MRADVRDVGNDIRHVNDAVAFYHTQFEIIEEHQLHRETPPHVPAQCFERLSSHGLR